MANQINIKVIENTLVDYPRLYKLIEFISQTEKLPGMIAEVGVYKGGTALLILENTKKKVLLFDTFTGLPAVDIKDTHNKGDFSDTSYEKVHELLGEYNNFFIFEGVFPEETGLLIYKSIFRFSLVHLDCDTYDSIKNSLNFFYDKITPGGIIVMDDYNAETCPGAKAAADEFIKDKAEKIIPTVQCQAIIVKN